MEATQLTLLPHLDKSINDISSSTFVGNMHVPVHRWFRYSAGFSAEWIRTLLKDAKDQGRNNILDPFAGSGTTLLEGEFLGMDAAGIEAHPFVARVARAKLLWRESPQDFSEYALNVLNEAMEISGDASNYPSLIQRCFPERILCDLDSLREAWRSQADGSSYSELTWLALASILRECSPVGTAQWQYVLPNKTKLAATAPYAAFAAKVAAFRNDMEQYQIQRGGGRANLYQDDARTCAPIQDGWADFVVTSPPYANNYDYADATRLEMSFFGEIGGWSDLQGTVRTHLIRSCTQHVSSSGEAIGSLLYSPLLRSISAELSTVYEKLASERQLHGGKKPYHSMILAYFYDMSEVFLALRRASVKGVSVCFVVGDSAPYGIHVPVETWLGELAITAGFESFKFEKTRDRNIKWENRKHRVPLHEGRLWIEG